jgi:hypothetical protein
MKIDPNLKVQNGNTFNARLILLDEPATAPTELTKREYFAAMAMQGLISNLSKYVQVHPKSSAHELIYPTMDEAVIIADRLVESLNK